MTQKRRGGRRECQYSVLEQHGEKRHPDARPQHVGERVILLVDRQRRRVRDLGIFYDFDPDVDQAGAVTRRSEGRGGGDEQKGRKGTAKESKFSTRFPQDPVREKCISDCTCPSRTNGEREREREGRLTLPRRRSAQTSRTAKARSSCLGGAVARSNVNREWICFVFV